MISPGRTALVFLALAGAFLAAVHAKAYSVADLDAVLEGAQRDVRDLAVRGEDAGADEREAAYFETLESIQNRWKRKAVVPPEGFESMHGGGVWLDDDDVAFFDRRGNLLWEESVNLLEERIASARREIQRLDPDAAAGAAPGFRDPDRAWVTDGRDPKRVCRGVLTQHRYERYGSGDDNAIRYEVMRKIRNLIDKALKGIDPHLTKLEITSKWVLVGGVILLGALVAFLIYRSLNRGPVSGALLPEEGDSLRVIEDPDVYRERAEKAAKRGEYREALRCLYLSILSRLERNGIVDYDRSKTNWEYLRQIRRKIQDAGWLSTMKSLTTSYDQKWYGMVSCSRDDYEEFRDWIDQLGNVPA